MNGYAEPATDGPEPIDLAVQEYGIRPAAASAQVGIVDIGLKTENPPVTLDVVAGIQAPNERCATVARARLTDFIEPGNNDFLAVNQFTVLGTRERRPDVVLLVNGLPLVLMELKREGKK